MDNGFVLSKLSDSVLLSQLNIAGTHDSATAFVSLEKTAQCQSLSIAEQLTMGVRLFDIRLFYRFGRFRLVHSLADCYTDADKREFLYFNSIFERCISFLRANPRETVIMSIKKDRGFFEKSFFTHFYNQFIRGRESFWYLENRIPTLGECRGKIVLMRRCKKHEGFQNTYFCGLDFSHWEDQGAADDLSPLTVALSNEFSATVQDRYGLTGEAKWNGCARSALDNCETAANKICIHFLSTSGEPPVKCAEYVNERFAEYPIRTDRAHGWILLDFPTRELCDKIMTPNINWAGECKG